MWFFSPIMTHAETGTSLEGCVAVAVGSHHDPTTTTLWYPTKTLVGRKVFSIHQDGVGVDLTGTPLTHSNTLVDILNSSAKSWGSSIERGERRRKKQRENERPSRIHVFEIPELYVNARPYEDIEAEEEARAVAAEKVMATVTVEAEEQETLIAVAVAALAARGARERRKACRFLQVPERF